MRYDRILVPTDRSRYGELAAREALEHLKAGGKLRLMHVMPVEYSIIGTMDGAIPVYDPVLTKKKLAAARAELEALARKLGKRVEAKVLVGAEPADHLAREARRFKAQLLVMATHGRGGLARVLFGSVAQKLLRLLRGPVLLVRPGRSPLP
jgi:nucleotide-binding universal stress UspA family protein